MIMLKLIEAKRSEIEIQSITEGIGRRVQRVVLVEGKGEELTQQRFTTVLNVALKEIGE